MAHSPVQGNLPGMQVSQVAFTGDVPPEKVKVTAGTKCTRAGCRQAGWLQAGIPTWGRGGGGRIILFVVSCPREDHEDLARVHDVFHTDCEL